MMISFKPPRSNFRVGSSLSATFVAMLVVASTMSPNSMSTSADIVDVVEVDGVEI